MPQSARALVKSGSIMSLLTLASRVLGLCREITKAALLGTSALSDAFSVAFMIPNLFRRLFAEGSIAAAFVPTLKEYLVAGETDNSRESAAPLAAFVSAFFTFLTFFVSLFVAAGMALAPFIVRVFSLAEFNETVILTRVMFPFLAFISVAALFQGLLNSVHVFVPSALAPILLNIVTICCAWGLSPFMANPARAMAAGIIAGGFLEAAIQAPFVWKRGFRLAFTSLKKACTDPGVRKTLRLIGPTIIGMAAYQLNDLVSTALAGISGEGIVSSLQYSLRLQELILGVFAVSVGTVILPDLAESAKTRRWDLFNTHLGASCDIIALVTIPVTFFALAEGETLIRLLFQTRRFDDTSVALTLAVFRPHIGGLYFIALNRVLAPAFYAQSNSKSPTIAGLISFACNITLAVLLSGPLKGAGIALALSTASAVNTALLLVYLGKSEAGSQGFTRKQLLYLARITLFSALALVPVLLVRPTIKSVLAPLPRPAALALPLALEAFLFAAAGAALLALSRDKALLWLLNALRGRKK